MIAPTAAGPAKGSGLWTRRMEEALHECAHAAVARHFGWTVTALMLVKGGGGWMNDAPPRRVDAATAAWQDAVIALAGPEATRRWGLLRLDDGCDSDRRLAHRAVRRANSAAPVAERSYRQANAEARLLVARYTPQIRREARQLYVKGRLV